MAEYIRRGGARPGAGRPVSTEPTVPVRVPERMAPMLAVFLAARKMGLPYETALQIAEFAEAKSRAIAEAKANGKHDA